MVGRGGKEGGGRFDCSRSFARSFVRVLGLRGTRGCVDCVDCVGYVALFAIQSASASERGGTHRPLPFFPLFLPLYISLSSLLLLSHRFPRAGSRKRVRPASPPLTEGRRKGRVSRASTREEQPFCCILNSSFIHSFFFGFFMHRFSSFLPTNWKGFLPKHAQPPSSSQRLVESEIIQPPIQRRKRLPLLF